MLDGRVIFVATTGDPEAARQLGHELRAHLNLPRVELKAVDIATTPEPGGLVVLGIRFCLLGPALMASCLTTVLSGSGGPLSVAVVVLMFVLGNAVLGGWYQWRCRRRMPDWLREQFDLEPAATG